MMQTWADYLDWLRSGEVEPVTLRAPGHAPSADREDETHLDRR